MNTIKKLLLLAGMALATVALAAPATAAAETDIFTHEGEPIGKKGVPAEFAGGPFRVNYWPGTEYGIECEDSRFELQVHFSDADFTDAEFTNCTSQTNSIPVQATPINLGNWKAEPDVANSRILITNLEVLFQVECEPGVFCSEHILRGGTVIANIPAGQQETIETLTLSDEGATIEINPPSSPFPVDIAGQLSGDGSIGIATYPGCC